MNTRLASALTALSWSVSAFAQPFINLDFEQAIVEPIYDDGMFAWLRWDLAAPGWSHSEGAATSIVHHRNTHLGIAQAYLLVDAVSPDWRPWALEGNYSLYFRNGSQTESSGGGYVHAFIAQTGAVPAEARSVRLFAEGPLSVFVNDVEIPMVSLGGLSYGGDIAAHAGTVSELKILNNAESPAVPHAHLIVDAIQFSPEPIPEPAASLLLIGGGVLWIASRRTPRTRRRC